MMDNLDRITDEILVCAKCPLHRTRINPVPGEGNPNAKIMLIGEAPGANEDRTGRPFCGDAGKVLDELLTVAGLKREEAFIGNILKCRPPNNRDPRIDEIIVCTPYLERQIEIIKPQIICTLGNYATAFILKKFGLKDKILGISRIHGKIFETESSYGKIKIIPMYHPAVAVYNVNMKKVLKKDFEILTGQIGSLR
ncbi:MAG: type-4 uracil-DNA glycosylase [candidate division WOR-3 bacterium]|nr:type-4 uracil-DNA glycosylase [candidate division WOR-3 bacterium]